MKIFFSNMYHIFIAGWHKHTAYSRLHERDQSGCTYHMIKSKLHEEKIL